MRISLKSKHLPALAAAFALIVTMASAGQTRNADSSARLEFLKKLVAAAEERTHHTVRYDGAYVHIPYPGGDVPADTGVCTDEVIRSYRAVGVDLQKDVHEDMEKNFSAYPRRWRWLTSRTDTNIDHRRVPNLMVFFGRKGETLPIHSTRGGLFAGRAGDLGFGRRHSSYWDCCERKIGGGRPAPDCSQHRARTAAGRRVVPLENHRPLPLFRPNPRRCSASGTTRRSLGWAGPVPSLSNWASTIDSPSGAA